MKERKQQPPTGTVERLIRNWGVDWRQRRRTAIKNIQQIASSWESFLLLQFCVLFSAQTRLLIPFNFHDVFVPLHRIQCDGPLSRGARLVSVSVQHNSREHSTLLLLKLPVVNRIYCPWRHPAQQLPWYILRLFYDGNGKTMAMLPSSWTFVRFIFEHYLMSFGIFWKQTKP